MADPVHRLDWADQLQEAIQLEDDAGRPVVLTVDEPLSAHGQRLCDALGVRVRVVTAPALDIIDYRHSVVQAHKRSDAGDDTLEICAHCGCEVDVAPAPHRPGCQGVGVARATTSPVLSRTLDHAALPNPPAKPVTPIHVDGLDALERMDAGLPQEPDDEDDEPALEEEAAVGQTAGSGSADPVSEPERAAPSSSTWSRAPQWTEESVVEAIVAWNTEHGAPPTSGQWQKKVDGCPTLSSVVKVFGTWSKAIAAAGFEPRPAGGNKRSRSRAAVRRSSGGAVGDLAVTGSAVSTDPVKEATAVLSPEPPLPVQPHPEETTTRIMRIMHGQPIPNGWEFLQWLGTETGLEYPPSFKADVVLLRKAAA